MRTLIIVPQQDRISGNWVSAQRFKQGLEGHGVQVTLHGIQLHDDRDIEGLIKKADPEVAILLHAYRSGKPWLDNDACRTTPFIVMLTGTDINQGLNDSGQRHIILSVLQEAKIIVLQNPLIADHLAKEYPALASKIRQLSPGVLLGTTPYDLRKQHGLKKSHPLFLCPAGLRPVKGVLELLKMFDQVIAETPESQLVFCGPILDQAYAEIFLAEVANRPGAHYIGAIPTSAMANAMRGADVILNNSYAEGISNSLLEAATLGIPILAKKIPGNAALVEHEGNGLMYNDPAEFTRYALRLCDQEERKKLTRPCKDRYNPGQEAEELTKILREVLRLQSGVLS